MRALHLHLVMILTVMLAAAAGLALPDSSQAATAPPPMSDSTATTEFNSSFGMCKGEAQHSCQVPIPPGCVVAQAPGTTKP